MSRWIYLWLFLFGACLATGASAQQQAACNGSGGWAWIFNNTAPTDNYVLTYDAASDCAFWEAAGSSSTVTFDNVLTGTNTSATLTCGTGCSMTTSGSGTIAATTSATATALASNGANCVGGNFPAGIDASGNVESCQTDILGNAGSADELSADGFNCPTGEFPLGIDTFGNAQSCQINLNGNAGTATALAANGANCSAGEAPRGVDASGAAESCAALGTVMSDCGTANQIWYDSAGSGTLTPACSAAKLSSGGTITLPDAEELKWTTDLCFERSASNTLTISTDCAGTRASAVAAELSLGRTTAPHGLLALQGTNNSENAGPHFSQWVGSVTDGPVFQIWGRDGGTSLCFGCRIGGTFGTAGALSTNATANYVWAQGAATDRMFLLSNDGTSVGSSFIFGHVAWAIDASDEAMSIGGTGTDQAWIKKVLKDSVTVDMTNVAGGGCDDQAGAVVTVTGAADGDPCTLGVTDDVADSLRLTFTCYVSAANTVQIRACNVGTTGTDPPSGTFTVMIWKLV